MVLSWLIHLSKTASSRNNSNRTAGSSGHQLGHNWEKYEDWQSIYFTKKLKEILDGWMDGWMHKGMFNLFDCATLL